MTGIIFITDDEPNFDVLDKVTQDWEMKAARGECGWICADCSCSFPNGMPNECAYGHESCTKIIQCTKKEAKWSE